QCEHDHAHDHESLERASGSVDRRRIARQDQEVEGQSTNYGGHRQKAGPAHQEGDEEHHFTRNGKLPSVRCPSRATTLQNTLQQTGGNVCKLTSSSRLSSGFTRPSPRSTRRFLPSSTRIVLKTGSSAPSNHTRTDDGGSTV